MEIIKVQEVLKTMRERLPDGSLKPFSITFFTADAKRQTGGKRIKLNVAIRAGLQRNMNDRRYVGVNVPHNKHHSYTVHHFLITEFNGMKVII